MNLGDPSPLIEADECFVVSEGGAVDLNYPVGVLQVASSGKVVSVRVIFVAEIENRFLVCLPHSAWRRKADKRVLKTGSLVRATALDVAACREDKREEIVGESRLRVWLGYFDEVQAAAVEVADGVLEAADHDFTSGLLPHGDALRALATEHFAFFSAGEGETSANPDGVPLESGSVDLNARVSKLEDVLHEMNMNMAKLLSMSPQSGVQSVHPTPKTAAKKEARPSALKPPGRREEAPRVQFDGDPTVKDFPDLDPSVVTAALNSGIPPETLEEMQKLMGSNKKGAKALRETAAVLPTSNALSESEEEEEGFGAAAASGDPVSDALSKLTSIVDHLALNKSRKKSSALDTAFEGLTTAGEFTSASTGKKAAAARRLLRTTFRDHPSEIYHAIERLMEEDVTSQAAQPGISNLAVTARGWVEHRSRVNAYRCTAHSSWGVAGILDSLRNGQVASARARACILLMQLDQSCIDKGSWTLSAELSLESPPPMATLAQHVNPDVANGEQPFSRLLDPRWSEVCMSFLKDQEDYLQRRRNLGRSSSQTQAQSADLEEAPNVENPRRRRPKPKAKASAAKEE